MAQGTGGGEVDRRPNRVVNKTGGTSIYMAYDVYVILLVLNILFNTIVQQ